MRIAIVPLALALALTPALAALGPQVARATVYGNPVPRFQGGEVGVGVGVSEDRLTGFLDWGVFDAGTLRILAGILDVAGSEDITEAGVLYRHKVGDVFNIGDEPVAVGAFGGIRVGTGDIGDVDVDFQQVDLGVGGRLAASAEFDVFASFVFQNVEVETETVGTGPGGQTVVVGERDDDDFGLVAGAELWASESVALGAELHFGLTDDDFGLWAELKF